MNRKNLQSRYSATNSSKKSHQFQKTGVFGISQFTSNQINNQRQNKYKTKNDSNLPLTQIQPYLMSIHSTLISNLRKKSIQRNLSQSQQQLIEQMKNNQKAQQFFSGILAIQACVKQLTKQNTSTIISFVKATNLLLINYKFLYLDFMNTRNQVKTSQSLNSSQKSQNQKLQYGGFDKFFDSLKFLSLLIKNYWNDVQQNKQKQQTNSEIVQNLKDEIQKLQGLISFQSLNNQKQSKHYTDLKGLQQKLVSLHNEQEHVIISQLQKQNNFLRCQIYQKQNTISEYQQSIYNVDLSRYRQNQQRQDYWAGYVKFNNNNYSQIINQGSMISKINQNTRNNQNTIKKLNQSHIKQRQELNDYLSILSKRMEQYEQENKRLRKQLKKIKSQEIKQQDSTIFQRQKLDTLINQIHQMKQLVNQMEKAQDKSNKALEIKHAQIEQKNKQIQNYKIEIIQKDQQITLLNQQIQMNTQILTIKAQQINKMNHDFIKQMQKYNTVFYKLTEQLDSVKNKSQHALKQNTKLLQKNKKLQQQIIKKQMLIVDMQTKSASYDFRRPDNIIHNEMVDHNPRSTFNVISSTQTKYQRSQRKISKHKQLKANIRQMLSKNKEEKMSKQQIRQSPFIARKQAWQSQNIARVQPQAHYSARSNLSTTPRKRNTQTKDIQKDRSKSPIDKKDLSSRKTMTIKIQGNKIVNQLISKKQQNTKKSSLMIRIQNSKTNDKQNSNSRKKILSMKKKKVSEDPSSNYIRNQLSPQIKQGI